MSRLYLTTFCSLFCLFPHFSQTELGKFLKYAEEKYEQGDYIYALDYYNRALSIDSNSIAILWGYAETLRAYKDYKNAELYYQKVYDREEAFVYPSSLLQLGLMQKQNGKYSEALETFKLAKKKYAKQKKDYPYQKVKREIESCLWAKSNNTDSDLKISSLDGNTNTKDAEFGHLIYDSILLFSSLRADSVSQNEEIYGKNYQTQLYKKDLRRNTAAEQIKSLYFPKQNVGNGAFSLDSSRFYFSLCSTEGHQYRCKIMVARYRKGEWSAPDSLGEIINSSGANTTMPAIATWDNKEILIFASDRAGGEGGLDLWYSEIRNGNQYGKARSIKSINTPDNETSPNWNNETKTLYFSSSWHDGFGGLDIFSSKYLGKFEEPTNIGRPFNSSANDLYYFEKDNKSFVTSNRIGVQYAKNPTCCSDIFVVEKPFIEPIPSKEETLEELNKRLPVTLYFHNDVPNPKSTATTSTVNYIDSYTEYRDMLGKYQKEYAEGLTGDKAEEAEEDIESFFIEYVDQGVKDLNQFRDLLLIELEKGRKINLTIKGFASPLAKSDYNVNLTKRRIASLVNYLSAYKNGVFKSYINQTATNGGKLTFSEVPFGEYTANQLVSDNLNDKKNSVYSRAAALERKIEILIIDFVTDSIIDKPVTVKEQVKEFTITSTNKKVTATYEVTNPNQHIVEFLAPRIPCDCSEVNIEKKKLLPEETTKVSFTFDPEGYNGKVVKSIFLKTKNSEEEVRLILVSEIKN